MTREILGNVLRFLLLFLIQGLLLVNVDLMDGKAQVFLYVLFIIMLPFRISTIGAMGLAFLMGLAVDMFYDSTGLHASAAVMTAFVRPYYIRAFTPRDDYDVNDRPSISRMGFTWFLKFSAVLIFVHCLWLFMLEAFTFDRFFDTLFRVMSTASITLLVSIIVVYLFAQKRFER